MNRSFWKRIYALGLVLVFAAVTLHAYSFVYAGTLSGTSVTLSSYEPAQTSVTHSFSITAGTTQAIQEIKVHYETSLGSNVRPSHLDLSSTTISSVSLGTGWTIDRSGQTSGVILISNSNPQAANSGDTVTFALASITNSAIGDCQTIGTEGLSDTCSVAITTYSDLIGSSIDTGNTTYTITTNPTLSFEIAGVSSGTTHNGITTTVTSTADSLPFGVISPGGVSYATHELDISTNAPAGYTVTAVLPNLIEGQYHNAVINEFAGLNATWTTPQAWSTPDGIDPNVNTGWFGANTSDSRVSGWSGSTSGLFGPFGTTARVVAYSSGPDSGSTIYVSYALGVNAAQPSDQYSGTIVYNIQVNY